jgi:predicted nucleotidyltransferase
MEIKALQQRLSGYPEIMAAYLFGSAVTGKLNPMSDIDVAVLLQEATPHRRELAIVFDVLSDVQHSRSYRARSHTKGMHARGISG